MERKRERICAAEGVADALIAEFEYRTRIHSFRERERDVRENAINLSDYEFIRIGSKNLAQISSNKNVLYSLCLYFF